MAGTAPPVPGKRVARAARLACLRTLDQKWRVRGGAVHIVA